VTGRPADERRDAILAFIDDWWREHGQGPLYREIAEGVGLATAASVMHHVRILAAGGCVELDRHTPRTIRVVEP
jgi:SOS-response transcriptional repressor LexA